MELLFTSRGRLGGMSTPTFCLATRGSSLALRQAGTVREALAGRRRTVELVEVETRGDQLRDELIHRLGKTGAFVRALDEQVLAGDADAAVHSMKDVPTEFPTDLVVGGVPERASPRDVLVTPDGRSLEELPDGAVVGTSSLRRGAQLRAERADLVVEPLRGNVDTRIQKLLAPGLQRDHERRLESAKREDGDESQPAESFDRTPEEWFDDLDELRKGALERAVETPYDAIVLAEAGIVRSGLADAVDYQRLSPERFVPAPGQGALAVTARDDDTADLLREHLDHPPTRVCTTVERTILGELGGGCVAPIGIYARLQGAHVNVTVRVLARDGSEEVAESRDLPVERHPEAARELAADLRERGAAALIERARVDSEEERRPKREGAEE